MWKGEYNQPLSLNSYLYVLANPTNLVDPSGYIWDDAQKENIRRLEKAFLDSAKRHNLLSNMDDNGFAALIAAVIIDEGHLDASDYTGDDKYWRWENAAIKFGCIVSGSYLEQVCKTEPDPEKCLAYVFNELPEDHPLYALASVGIGNVKLYTAANMWQGKTCRVVPKDGEWGEECVQAQVKLQLTQKNIFGVEYVEDIRDPFDYGYSESYDPEERPLAYKLLANQLHDDRMNIEYVAAGLEQGALRAFQIGIEPTGFNSVSWFKRGVQTNEEIEDAWGHPGAAMYPLENIWDVLNIWGLSTSWSIFSEKQYWHWRDELGWGIGKPAP